MEHNLDPNELTLALSAAVLDAGIEDSLIDVLSKSKRGGGEKPQEPELIVLLTQWRGFFKALVNLILKNLSIYLSNIRQISPRHQIFPWVKQANLETVNPRFTHILGAEELIYQHVKTAAGLGDPSYWDRGYQAPDENLALLSAQAYQRGRGRNLALALDGPGTYSALHTASYITAVGARMSNLALQRGIEGLESEYPGTIANFYKRGKSFRPDLWAELEKNLRGAINEPTFKRDMERIGSTELRWAFNIGRVQHFVEQGYENVYYLVQPEACSHCRRLLLHADGRPRIFPLRRIVADIASSGGLNKDRDEQHWKPTACLHPHCHCSIHAYTETELPKP